ncbi:hypothetical protein ACNKCJ_001051 [Cronobacter dublinensis]|uniref:hypothetical protein n=1 Tax=Cronobacter dublinensis TaxID=413497 RepID=UPI0024AFD188|nr:hypothetical protein [Cronobacter dublinensis]EKM6456224.1 hypothetical protein [Cronobacter dublinensis]EKY3203950.1 hypothetical protein [Cronobacter dublinensis]ELQ6158101.1 hypothetical protein [Cronobacter dublinensis]ELY2816483.1 hypothetical protein [Cronobacter dublinensis]ELY4332380.1 hypothetical protein [Cronobacter dublinensis]
MKRDFSAGSLISLFLLAIITLNITVLWTQSYEPAGNTANSAVSGCTPFSPDDRCEGDALTAFDAAPRGPLPGEPPLHLASHAEPLFSPAQIALYREPPPDLDFPYDSPEDAPWMEDEGEGAW